MGYLHIPNLYKDQSILMFRECYALEKIHGTSAHIRWRVADVGAPLTFFSGGEKHSRFVELFDHDALLAAFAVMGHEAVTVYGEAYGGKQQGQSHRYGPDLRFVAFDVMIGGVWLTVPNAEDVAGKLGLEFVHQVKVPTDLEALDAERDAPSVQARRNGIEEPKAREGVVLRPLVELVKSNGERVIAKHKGDEFRETKSPRVVVDPAQVKILEDAAAIADEWVTPMRLDHVLDKLGQDIGIEKTGDVVRAMVEDVLREGTGELVDSKPARQAIGRRAAELFKARCRRIR